MKIFKYTKKTKSKGIKIRQVTYGTWALQSYIYKYISAVEILNIKQYLLKILKNKKTYKFNISLNKIFTKKPLETRMGGGKGAKYTSKGFIKPGMFFLEIYNVPSSLFYNISNFINSKTSIKFKILKLI